MGRRSSLPLRTNCTELIVSLARQSSREIIERQKGRSQKTALQNSARRRWRRLWTCAKLSLARRRVPLRREASRNEDRRERHCARGRSRRRGERFLRVSELIFLRAMFSV